MVNFRELLNSEIARQGLSYRKLGKMCGMTGRAISYYARGKRTPDIYNADKVMRALGVVMEIGKRGEKIGQVPSPAATDAG